MDETDNTFPGSDAAPSHEIKAQNRTIEQDIEFNIYERGTQLELYNDGESDLGKFLDTIDKTIRPELIKVFQQEIDELQALDPSTTTREDLEAIYSKYRQAREALLPS